MDKGGEENYEAPSVDEGRCPHVEDARPRESKNDGHCAETEAKRGSDVSESNATSRDVRGRSKEEKGVKARGNTNA
jgi:hypothetical protein